MIYVALLRGINVGGNNKIEMSKLKVAFEGAGMQSVSTYINSGNVIFVDNTHKPAEIEKLLEETIIKTFALSIKVLLVDIPRMQKIAKALPDAWQNNAEMRCDVMFLWPEYDNPKVLQQLSLKPAVDTVKYVPGALLWHVMRTNVKKSGMHKLVSAKLYKHMTIRNCNTTRKLLEIMTSTNE